MKAVTKPKEVAYESKWEQQYAMVLDLLVRSGAIEAYWYQPVKIILANRTTYTPDFLIQDKLGNLEFHEVKGYKRDDAMVKLKVAAAVVPWASFKLITDVKGMAYVSREI